MTHSAGRWRPYVLKHQMATHLKGKMPGYPALKGLQGHTNITVSHVG